MALEIGMHAEDSFAVEGPLTTDVGGTLGFEVLSTPGMIGMMERTAAAPRSRTWRTARRRWALRSASSTSVARARARGASRARRCRRSSTGASCASVLRCSRATGRLASGRTSAASLSSLSVIPEAGGELVVGAVGVRSQACRELLRVFFVHQAGERGEEDRSVGEPERAGDDALYDVVRGCAGRRWLIRPRRLDGE